jgi:hypothetical protein
MIGNINYYEFLSVELTKKIKETNEKIFLEAYYHLAMSGIESSAFATTIAAKLKSSFEKLYTGKQFY